MTPTTTSDGASEFVPANQAVPATATVPQHSGPGWVKLALQILGSLAILAIVFSALSSPGAVLAALKQADWRLVLLACGVVAVSEVLSGLKWRLLMGQLGSPPSIPTVLRLYWIGMFYGTYLPGSVSGDAARVFLTRRQLGTTAAAVAVFMQRNTGLAAMLFLALLFAILSPVRIGLMGGGMAWLDTPLPWFVLATLGYFLINMVLISPQLAELCHGLFRRFLPVRLSSILDRALNSAVRGRGLLRLLWGRSALPLTVSVITQLMDVAVLLILARALGFMPDPKAAYQAMAATSLAGMLPVTINGIGIREVGFGLLLQSGAVAGQAVALGLLTTGLYLACALPGAALHGGALLRASKSANQL